jgi:hypothetical protein
VQKHTFLAPFLMLKTIFLPRQARDTYEETLKNEAFRACRWLVCPLLLRGGLAWLVVSALPYHRVPAPAKTHATGIRIILQLAPAVFGSICDNGCIARSRYCVEHYVAPQTDPLPGGDGFAQYISCNSDECDGANLATGGSAPRAPDCVCWVWDDRCDHFLFFKLPS